MYLKRSMAGGEKKRVSPIDSEIERERGQVQQMKLEPMVFSDEPTSLEFQYKEPDQAGESYCWAAGVGN